MNSEVGKFNHELSEFRKLFLLDANENPNKYHQLDIQRVKNDGKFLSRFLVASKGDVMGAFKLMTTALEWRKNFDVYGITKDSIPTTYFSLGAVLPFNRDRKGNIVLLLRVKQYKRPSGEEQYVRRFIIYWLETMDREYKTEQITVVFNCKDCGLSNMDMDLIRFMVNAFTNYYPRFLSCILVFEMPWLYNAAWKVIKSWLPESSVNKIKMVNRESILEYIEKSQLHFEMGGTETVSAPFVSKRQENSEGKQTIPDNCTNEVSHLVNINPSFELKFPYPGFSEKLNNDTTFSISNVSKATVMYKIKTTSRERYRAWPYSGLIRPGDRVNINAHLVNNSTCHENDKLLILVSKVNDGISDSELNNSRPSHTDSIVEYKLKCMMATPLSSERKNGNVNSTVNMELQHLHTKLVHLEQNLISLHQKQVFWLSIGCLLLTLHILLDFRDLLYSLVDYIY